MIRGEGKKRKKGIVSLVHALTSISIQTNENEIQRVQRGSRGGNEAESGGAADSRYRITSNIFRANVRANALKKRGGGGRGMAWSRKRRKDGGRMKVFDNKPAAGSPLLNFYWRRRVNLRLNPPLVTLPRAIAPTRVRQLV